MAGGKIHGHNAYFAIDERSVGADGNSITLDITRDVAEVTGFGDIAKEFVDGVYGWTVSGDLFYNSTLGREDHTIYDVLTSYGEVAIIFRPKVGVGEYEYTGNAILTAYGVSVPVAGAVTASFSMQGNGELSRTILA